MNRQHTFIVVAPREEGIAIVQTWVKKELQIQAENNPDVTILQYGLFSVTDARRVVELATGIPFVGASKVVIIVANRAYHEAQNALLKVFEEPPEGAYLFLVLPTLGGILPTLRSRVQMLSTEGASPRVVNISETTRAFLSATKEKRSEISKQLASGKDDEKKRENREEAIALVNDIEAVAYVKKERDDGVVALLNDIAILRSHLYDRSAPVKMILEHLALVIPKDLV